MNASTENDNFSRLIAALEPWLEQVVIVGGWAHRLYRLEPRAQRPEYTPLMTLDTELPIPLHLPIRETEIRERLVASGFQEEWLGDDNPPATHYRLSEEESGF